MIIKTIKFIKSSPDVKSCPKPNKPEFAFVGRSNVGKSSLINMLINRKNFVQVSSYPGKTKYINHYLINELWYLVDLPGYGYARRSKSSNYEIKIKEYLLKRENLMYTFLLIDSRHLPISTDIKFIEWTAINHIDFAICFTKIDKISKNKLEKNIMEYKRLLTQYFDVLPPIFSTSSIEKIGREELLEFIEIYVKTFFEERK